jgi:hypothetical protein
VVNIGRYCLLFLDVAFPGEIGGPNAPSCRSQKVGIIKFKSRACKSRADRSKPVGLLVFPSAACSAMAARPIWSGLTVETGENCPNYRDVFSVAGNCDLLRRNQKS